MFAAGFSWFNLIPVVDHDQLLAPLGLERFNQVYLHAWLACFLIMGFAVLARMGLERAKGRQGIDKYCTDDGPSFLVVAELLIGGLTSMMGDMLSKRDVRTFFPFIAALFLYVFTCNIMGIFPGMQPPTQNINTNVGMALSSFLVFNAVGLKRDPVGYIKHIMGPVWWLVPLMFIVELVSLAARPITLALRLTANLYGDHLVFTLVSDMTSPIPVAWVLMPLAIMVSGIQAFVFALLSTIYIALSLPHDDHH